MRKTALGPLVFDKPISFAAFDHLLIVLDALRRNTLLPRVHIDLPPAVLVTVTKNSGVLFISSSMRCSWSRHNSIALDAPPCLGSSSYLTNSLCTSPRDIILTKNRSGKFLSYLMMHCRRQRHRDYWSAPRYCSDVA